MVRHPSGEVRGFDLPGGFDVGSYRGYIGQVELTPKCPDPDRG